MQQLKGVNGDSHNIESIINSPEKTAQQIQAKIDNVQIEIKEQIPEISKQIVKELDELESFLKEFKEEHIKQGQFQITDKEKEQLNHQLNDITDHNDVLTKHISQITETLKGLKTIEQKRKDMITKQGKKEYKSTLEQFESKIVQDVMLEISHRKKESRGEQKFQTITSFIPSILIMICCAMEYFRSLDVINQVDDYIDSYDNQQNEDAKLHLQIIEDFRYDIVTLCYLSAICFLSIVVFKAYFILCHACNYIDINDEQQVKKAGIHNIFWKKCEKFTDISIGFVFLCTFTCFIFWWVATILEYNQEREFDEQSQFLSDKNNEIYGDFFQIIEYSSYMPFIVYVPLQIIFCILAKIFFRKKKEKKALLKKQQQQQKK